MDTKLRGREIASVVAGRNSIRTARGAKAGTESNFYPVVVSIWCPVCKGPGRSAGILETIENLAIPLHIRNLQAKSRYIYNLRKAARKNSAAISSI